MAHTQFSLTPILPTCHTHPSHYDHRSYISPDSLCRLRAAIAASLAEQEKGAPDEEASLTPQPLSLSLPNVAPPLLPYVQYLIQKTNKKHFTSQSSYRGSIASTTSPSSSTVCVHRRLRLARSAAASPRHAARASPRAAPPSPPHTLRDRHSRQRVDTSSAQSSTRQPRSKCSSRQRPRARRSFSLAPQRRWRPPSGALSHPYPSTHATLR